MEYKSQNVICQNCKGEFIIEPEDFLFYEKIKVPPPTFCPECRQQRRYAWRNERILYHRNCDLCDKKIVSIYRDKNLKVYCQDCWFSDKWDAIDYGQDYDFYKPFFEQFLSLFKKVPEVNLNGHASNIDSPYVNYVAQVKKCYFCFGGGFSENLLFSNLGIECKDSAELSFSNNCEFCYEILNCKKCYKVYFGKNLKDCLNCYFLADSTNCNNCIMCCNLKNKKYCYKNKQFTKEEYEKIEKEFIIKLHKDINSLKNEFYEFNILQFKKYAIIANSNNCTGDNISDSFNVKNCFDSQKSENCKYCDVIPSARDTYDSTNIGLNIENIYENMTGSVNISNSLFSCIVRNNSMNIQYSYFLTSCKNCFSCIGLKSKQYCILNKQYTKEQYEELVPKIIKHMSDMPYIDSKGRVYKYGEFFPSELSPFAYNETIAQEYFPLTKEQAEEQGYKWKDKEERNYQIDITNEDIPDDITNIKDEDILNKVIECKNKGDEKTQCTEAFKIIPEELQFYKRMNLPLPRFCPNCRHYERLAQRNPLKLWHRHCMKEGCHNEFETSYSPDRPEIIYCEKCYQQEVY